MGKVIQGNFLPEENCGYLLNGEKITGVYMGNLSAENEVFLGGEMVSVLNKETGDKMCVLDTEEINRFCLMWLCIFDPDVIKEEV